jgi:hypothetical protein
MVISKKKTGPRCAGSKIQRPLIPQNPKSPKSLCQGSKSQTPRVIAWQAARPGRRRGQSARTSCGKPPASSRRSSTTNRRAEQKGVEYQLHYLPAQTLPSVGAP